MSYAQCQEAEYERDKRWAHNWYHGVTGDKQFRWGGRTEAHLEQAEDKRNVVGDAFNLDNPPENFFCEE